MGVLFIYVGINIRILSLSLVNLYNNMLSYITLHFKGIFKL